MRPRMTPMVRGMRGRTTNPLLRAGAAFLLLAVAGCAQNPASLPQRHMVSAANPHAARAGLEILRAGGSAVDAAIATQAVLTLVEPQSSGIGGGAFLMHFDGKDRRVAAYDGRETAPAAARPDMFLDKGGKRPKFIDAVVGGRSVGVPGVLRMLEMAHRRHGKLPWRRLFQPAITLAEKGFRVSPRLHRMIGLAKRLKDFPAARAYFFTKDGKPVAAGAVLKNRPLATTLRRIAAGGADAFYKGPIAGDIVAAVQTSLVNQGTLTAEDLAGYRAKSRAPLCRPYREWRVCSMPPPTSGGLAVLQILGLLESYDLGRLEPGSAPAVHLISEASRLAYADRNTYAADPDFVAVPVDGLLDRRYLDRRARRISAARSMGKALPGLPRRRGSAEFGVDRSLELPSTSHFSIVDGDGNAVSMTTTIENIFGSRLMVRGFMLNNELTDFSLVPVIGGRPVANRVEPGKRPRSSMTPVIVTDKEGRLLMVVGSPGGSRIITYVAKTLIAALDWRLSMQAAIDLPNHANRNGPTELEKGTRIERIRAALQRLGHKVRVGRLGSGLHGIRITPAGLDGGADRRREGVALGD